MKQSKQTIFITIILAIFILVTGVYFSSLISEFKNGKANSQDQISYIVRNVSDALKYSSNDNNKFVDSILDCIKNSNSIASLTVKENHSIVFSFPADASKAMKIPFSLTKTTEIYDSQNKPFELTVTIYLLKASSIYKKGLIALGCIVFGIMVCIFYISTSIYNKSKSEVELIPETEIEKNYIRKLHDLQLKTKKLSDEDFNKIDKTLPVNETENKHSLTENTEEIESVEEINTVESITIKTDETASFNAEVKEEIDDKSNIYSPMTSFRWESKFEERLTGLVKNAEGDQMELSLFLIRIPFINWNNSHINALKALIHETFHVDENIFSYKEDGIAAIMPEKNIDDSIAIANKLNVSITSILAKAGMDLSLGIGISSVSSRIVSSERLIKEADQALLYALGDKNSPVVAFRVNAQKYREYILKNKLKY